VRHSCVSPSTFQLDAVNKKQICARVGAKEFWTVDPEPKNVDVTGSIKIQPSRVAKLAG
jgi:Uma2 family endonuclease